MKVFSRLLALRRERKAAENIRHKTKKSERRLPNGQVIRTMIDVPDQSVEYRERNESDDE